ncbi:hypothetical protein F0562_005980 [Nyssa sinensis]|uniref:VHS domain-containing protein n=1 Tax=Nyssa sinensis TaxID=561372 RepID=A0A5J5AQB3_9ASTE|nr:hypothetical protein F0562_005980 [Nyssa sinensis]
MAAELVNSATSEKLTEMDWMKNIEICELVARDQRQAKDVIKAIKKRLGNKNSNTQLFAVMLLEMLMNNIGEHVHRQVIDLGLLPILVKIVKKKSDLPVREKIFLLLDATQTSLGGASGKFPQYYSAYYDLVVEEQAQFSKEGSGESYWRDNNLSLQEWCPEHDESERSVLGSMDFLPLQVLRPDLSNGEGSCCKAIEDEVSAWVKENFEGGSTTSRTSDNSLNPVSFRRLVQR